MLPLPNNQGFAEVVISTPKKGETTKSEFAVYFLGSDRTSPLSPEPPTGTITVNTPKGEMTIELKPVKGALISTPGASVLGGHEADGTLSFELGGDQVKVPLGGR